MVSTKVLMTITLPGATLLSEKYCEENPKESYNKNSLIILERVKQGKKWTKEKTKINYYTRKAKDAYQAINISDIAYEEFTSTNCPEWKTIGDWKRMTKTQRLISHLDRICKSLGGTHFEYEVLPD